MRARRGELETISVSALDLFASALGAFILLTVLLLPFYLKQPALEQDVAGAAAELDTRTAEFANLQARRAALEDAIAETEQRQAELAGELQGALSALASAERRLQQAQDANAAQPVPEPRRGGRIEIAPLDLVIVLDTTSSMKFELETLTEGLAGLIRILDRLSPSLRVGVVAYRDRGEAYVTRRFALSQYRRGRIGPLLRFVRDLSASGGGDLPEAIDAAMQVAVDMRFRDEAAGHIVVIGDAPARLADARRALNSAASFATRGQAYARTVSTVFPGDDPSARVLMQDLAAAGGGALLPGEGALIETILLAVVRGAA